MKKVFPFLILLIVVSIISLFWVTDEPELSDPDVKGTFTLEPQEDKIVTDSEGNRQRVEDTSFTVEMPQKAADVTLYDEEGNIVKEMTYDEYYLWQATQSATLDQESSN